MSRADGVLRVVLTGKWWDMAHPDAVDRKDEEYRGRHWALRLLTRSGMQSLDYFVPKINPDPRGYQWVSEIKSDFHPYHTITASRGYTANTWSRKILLIDWGEPLPKWSGTTVTGECFRIHMGEWP